MRYTPSRRLRNILRPAFKPCEGFKGDCRGVATWRPRCGYVPRGFIGALGRLKEIKVVILLSEPGNPHPTESYRGSKKLRHTCEYTFKAIEGGTDRFHRRLGDLLNLLFPDLPLEDQLRKTWVTQTYLCSAPMESGRVPRAAEDECAERYLSEQLDLLSGRPVLALGVGKAQRRAERVIADVENLIPALHPSARKSNAKFQRSYETAAKLARAMFESSG